MPSLAKTLSAWVSSRRRNRNSIAGAASSDLQPPLPLDPAAYTLGEELGCGTTSTVYAATCSTHPALPLAIKCLDLDRAGGDLELAIREVRLASSIRSPHLTPLLAAFGRGSELWLVQPRALCSVRDLLDAHSRSPAGSPGLADHRAAAAIVKAVAGGLVALHAAGAAHRDVKASNVLLFDAGDGQVSVRLADLGTAGVGCCACPSITLPQPPSTRAGRGRALALGASLWRLASGKSGGVEAGGADPAPPPARPTHGIATPFAASGSGSGRGERGSPLPPPPGTPSTTTTAPYPKHLPAYKTFAGSPAWMAPEVFNAADGSTTDAYSTSADLYSLACLVVELAHGAPPGAATPLPVLAMARLHGPAPELQRGDWPAGAAALVSACAAREPGERPSAAGVLSSPWLKGERVEVEGGRVLAALLQGTAPPPPAPPGSTLVGLDGPAARARAGRAAKLQGTLSDAILAPFRARAGPPARHHHHPGSTRGSVGRLSTSSRACKAAALLDAATAGAILRSALLPGKLSHERGPLAPLLAAALPPGAPLPTSLAALGTATAVAIFGRDHSAGRALGRFHYRLGAAFLRVPLPAEGGEGLPQDALYEAGNGTGTAWAGPVLFFLGRRRHALPGAAPSHPSMVDQDAPLVLALRTAVGARHLRTLLESTATGGRLLAEVLPARAVPRDSSGPGGLARSVWLYPSGDSAAWPSFAPWSALPAREAAAAWVHAAGDLTSAAHGKESSPADVMSGRLGPPRAWQGVVADLIEARRLVVGRRV